MTESILLGIAALVALWAILRRRKPLARIRPAPAKLIVIGEAPEVVTTIEPVTVDKGPK